MSSLQQMMIRGVRSVGIDDEEVHVIKFLNPLTIINGPNGTGKTTTIECLNYVTSASLPAGKLATFIHSLKMAGRPRVDGMVKLQFLDYKKRPCVITRRMSASMKNDKLKCEAEESTIEINIDGTNRRISSKTADVKKEMLNLLGIPAAILNNVIFCHQEDSCWPLSEPKELKTRFDSIFQLTKFVKAVDQMKKLKKEYESELKLVEEKKINAEIKIQSKAKYTEEKISSEKYLLDSKTKLLELEAAVEDYSKQLQDGQRKYQEMERQQKSLESKQLEVKMLNDQLKSLKVDPYSGSESMLRNEIKELCSSSDFQSLQRERESMGTKMQSLNGEISYLESSKQQFQVELDKYKAADMHRNVLRNELGNLEKEITKTYDVLPGIQLEENFSALLAKESQDFNNMKMSFEQERSRCRRNLEGCQTEYTTLDCEVANAQKTMQRIDNEIVIIQRKIEAASSSEATMVALSSEIATIEKQLSSLPPVAEQEASQLKKERIVKQTKLDDLKTKLKDSEKFEVFERDLSRKKEEMAVFQGKLEDIRVENEQSFLDLFGSFPRGVWGPRVAQMRNKCQTEQTAAQRELSAFELSFERNKEGLKQLQSEELKIQKEARELEEKIRKTCGCSPEEVASKLENIRSELKTARKELAPMNTKAALYESWSSDVKEKSCCPLCDRRFTSISAANDLSTKLMNMSISFPGDIERLKSEVESLEEMERLMVGCVALVDQIKTLLHEKLPVVQQKMTTSTIKVEKETTALEQLKDKSFTFSSKATKANQIQSVVSLMDDFENSISRLSREIDEIGKMIGSGSKDGLSCSDLKESISQVEAEIASIVSKSDQLQETANKRNVLANKVNNLREQRVKIGEAAAQSTLLIEQLASKKEERKTAVLQADNSSSQIPTITSKISTFKTEMRQLEEEFSGKEKVFSKRHNEMMTVQYRLVDLIKKLTALTCNKQNMEQSLAKIKEVDEKLLQTRLAIDRLNNQVSDLDSLRLRKRTLEDQLTRMMLEAKVAVFQEELSKIDSSVDINAFRNNLADLNKKREQAELEKSRIGGQKAEVEKKLKEAIAALSKKEMKDAEKVYRDVIVDKLVVCETIMDLAKYGKCLDSSILKFHSDKMAAINEILDDLWRKVYTGGDIESIKIKSEVASSNDKRKSYDYRVVMVVEGGVEMDMRERCSAGQKMLACILIRIALADVFGNFCSIIALDEPTTNLDVAKVEHMAEMLNDLIAARRNDDSQGNERGRQFQMIVITHDQRLVEKLTLGTRPEFFYTLGKNHKGLSYIRRKYPDGHMEKTTA